MDESHLEMSKALNNIDLSWLTYLFNVVWKSGAVPVDWQTGVKNVEKFLLIFRAVFYPRLKFVMFPISNERMISVGWLVW